MIIREKQKIDKGINARVSFVFYSYGHVNLDSTALYKSLIRGKNLSLGSFPLVYTDGLSSWAFRLYKLSLRLFPGKPIEIIAGVLYGGFTGLLTCLLGCTVSLSVFFFCMYSVHHIVHFYRFFNATGRMGNYNFGFCFNRCNGNSCKKPSNQKI